MSSQRFIARVTYVSRNRKTTTYVKLPYGAAFGLTETLTRAWALGLVRWFRIDTIRPGEITPEIRASLERWPNRFKELLTEVSA